MASPAPTKPACALDPTQFVPYTLSDILDVSHNTKRFRFALKPEESLNLPVSSCIMLRAKIGDADVMRPYTPVSDNEAKGHFELIIKTYPQGKMSAHLFTLKKGDSIDVKGPFQKLQHPYKQKKIGMIAGGTGITPMLQVFNEMWKNKADTETTVTLLNGNMTPADILCREELEALEKAQPDRFKVINVISKPDDDWKGASGHINADLITQHLPAPGDDTLIFVCGPPPMMAAISGDKNPDKSQGEVSGILKELGYTKDMVYKF